MQPSEQSAGGGFLDQLLAALPAIAGSATLPAIGRDVSKYRDMMRTFSNGVGTVGSYKPRIGDIIVHSPLEDVRRFSPEHFTGNPAQMHAGMVLPPPDGKGRKLLRLFGSKPSERAISPNNRSFASFIRMLGRDASGTLLHPIQAWSKAKQTSERLASRWDKLEPAKKLQATMAEYQPIDNMRDFLLDEDRAVRILRPKERLSHAERKRLGENAANVLGLYPDEDMQASQGIRNMFGVDNNSPSVCIGGVCSTYDGIRKVPSAGSAVGADLSMSPDFETVYASKLDPTALRSLRRAGMARIGVRSLPLALGLLLSANAGFNPFGGQEPLQLTKEGSVFRALPRVFRKFRSDLRPISLGDVKQGLSDHGASILGMGAGVGLLAGASNLIGRDKAIDSVSDTVGGATFGGTLGTAMAIQSQLGRKYSPGVIQRVTAYARKNRSDRHYDPGGKFHKMLKDVGFDTMAEARKHVSSSPTPRQEVFDLVDTVDSWNKYKTDRRKTFARRAISRSNGPSALLSAILLSALPAASGAMLSNAVVERSGLQD